MHGLVKVGYTDRDPRARAQELSNSTSVPAAFKVHAWWPIEGGDARGVEQRIHRHLDKHRYSKGREFFALSATSAQVEIELLLEKWEKADRGRSFSTVDITKELEAARTRQEDQRRTEEAERQTSAVRKWNTGESKIALQSAHESAERDGQVPLVSNPIFWISTAAVGVLLFGSTDGLFVTLYFLTYGAVVGGVLFAALRLWQTLTGERHRVREKKARTLQARVDSLYELARLDFFKSHGFSDVPTAAVNATLSVAARPPTQRSQPAQSRRSPTETETTLAQEPQAARDAASLARVQASARRGFVNKHGKEWDQSKSKHVDSDTGFHDRKAARDTYSNRATHAELDATRPARRNAHPAAEPEGTFNEVDRERLASNRDWMKGRRAQHVASIAEHRTRRETNGKPPGKRS